jgi:nucleoside-diphosphate-sugar epimerase
MRDFIYVEDVAKANILALESEKEGFITWEPGSPSILIYF